MPSDAWATESSRQWTLDAVEQDVLDGLPASAQRLARAAKAEDYYQLRNEKHANDYKRPDEEPDDFAKRPKEYSWVTQAVVDKLNEPLYNPGPSRAWQGDASVDEWLQGIYADTCINVRLASCDRAAMLGHMSMLQIEATGDFDRPIRYWVWKPHEFEVFTRDNDPVSPWAVCTIEQIPAPGKRGQIVTRYRLWSAWEQRTYHSEPYGIGEPWGRKAVRVEDEQQGETPYPGVLPFVFVRNKPPDSNLWEGGIGDALVYMNQSIDRKLSNLSLHVDQFLNPIPVAQNLAAGARLTIKPGQPIVLPAMKGNRTGDTRLEPKLTYLQPSLNVEGGWYHLRSFSDSQMEELQIPLTIVRNDSSTDLSGVAIMYKTVPITKFIKARQPRYTEVEIEVAAKTLAVSAAWYGDTSHFAAASDPQLTVMWPEPVIPQPTPERNEADQWELEQGLNDPISVLARRTGMNVEEAKERVKESAKLWKEFNSLMEDVKPKADAAQSDSKSDGQEEPKDNATDGTSEDTGRNDG